MITGVEFPQLDPAELLATEEVLLEAAEAGRIGEALAFWESRNHFIVLGYGNKVATETDPAACARHGIPILRRISGGGTVLQGPGVLNYCLILRADESTPLSGISSANQFIMQRNAEALTSLFNAGLTTSKPTHPQPLQGGEQSDERAPFVPLLGGVRGEFPNCTVDVQGHTDLAIAGRKFSGNAQRRRRTHLLFHGAILLNLDLDLLDAVLPMPSLQPDYRHGRSHQNFLTQLELPADAVKRALSLAWSATPTTSLDSLVSDWRECARELAAGKYSRADWNFRV